MACRPKQSDVSIVDLMLQYILYRIMRANTETIQNPWEEYNHTNTERFCRPIGDHFYGWGGHWAMYGFDERVMKHVIFPYFAQRGQVSTWIYEPISVYSQLPDDHPVKIDFLYSSSLHNEFIDMRR